MHKVSRGLYSMAGVGVQWGHSRGPFPPGSELCGKVRPRPRGLCVGQQGWQRLVDMICIGMSWAKCKCNIITHYDILGEFWYLGLSEEVDIMLCLCNHFDDSVCRNLISDRYSVPSTKLVSPAIHSATHFVRQSVAVRVR